MFDSKNSHFQIAHWTILLNLLWVLWQKSGADPELEQMRYEEKWSKDLNLEEEKGGQDLGIKEEKDFEKLEKKDESAATALMG